MPLRIVCAVIIVAMLAGCTAPLAALDHGKAALAYRTDMVGAFAGLGDALTGIATASQTPSVSDQQWRDDLLADLETVRTARTNLEAVTAPPALAANHAKLKSALDLCVSAVDKMEPGIKAGTVDLAGLYGAAALFQQCSLDLAPVINDISAYVAQFDK
jgi:hypothetical protein